MQIWPPCKDCAEKNLGCHGFCPRYKDYRGQIEAQNTARQEAAAEDRDVAAARTFPTPLRIRIRRRRK